MPPVIICYQVIDNTIRANMPENQSNINLSGHINLIINGSRGAKRRGNAELPGFAGRPFGPLRRFAPREPTVRPAEPPQ